jgi:hypothetical protein
MRFDRQTSIDFAVRAAELVAASLLAYYFRALIDQFLVPFQLSEVALFAIRVVFLVIFILVFLRLHGLLIDYLKKIGLLKQDFKW